MNVGAFIEQAIRNWWSEKDMTSQQYIDNCCSNINTAHFLQMAQDEVNEIGCAISHYPEGPNKKTSYLVCNYSVTNRRDTPVYQTGSPASKCKTGNNPNYSALCSESE